MGLSTGSCEHPCRYSHMRRTRLRPGGARDDLHRSRSRQLDGVFEDSMGFTYMFENLGQSVDPDPVRLIVEGSLISYECNGVNDREISMDILRAITSGTQSPHLPPELMA
eukprot:2644294-Pyramimonas_sp.AAC.1